MLEIPKTPTCYSKAKKPRQLSDPGCDWMGCDLDIVLEKPFSSLRYKDYACLFASYLPGGTYDEVRVYVPWFVDHLINKPDDRLDLITGWAWWSSEYWNRISDDHACNYVVSVHRYLLAEFTKEFKIIHFDKQACKQKGWDKEYFNYVKGTETVNEFLSDLWRFKVHRQIVLEFIYNLSDFEKDMTKVGWFVELSVSRFDVYTPPIDEGIYEILLDKKLIDNALELVLKNDLSNSYWDDAFKLLDC